MLFFCSSTLGVEFVSLAGSEYDLPSSRRYGMDGTQILTLVLSLGTPWVFKNQYLDTSVPPHRLDFFVGAEKV